MTAASRPLTSPTSRAAGRACSPCAVLDGERRRRPPPPRRDAAPSDAASSGRTGGRPCRAARCAPRWRPRSGWRRPTAATAATTSPSTIGADDRVTRLAGRGVVEQVQRQLGAEHGAAEVHQDDDAGGTVDPLDGLLDLHGVGAERRLVEPGRDLDPHRTAVQHLVGQRQRGPRQRPAVRDDDDADVLPPEVITAVPRPLQVEARLAAAAATSSATLVAPGSWWPTLRSPR